MINFKVNQKVWILAGQFADTPMKGIVVSINNIDNRGYHNTYCDAKTSTGLKHVNITLMFTHKPKQVIDEDCYGTFTTWK